LIERVVKLMTGENFIMKSMPYVKSMMWTFTAKAWTECRMMMIMTRRALWNVGSPYILSSSLVLCWLNKGTFRSDFY